MTPVLVGQLLGISFACGLNLYATVAALSILSHVGRPLPGGLQGLEDPIVITSAVLLYLVEAIVDKVRHADSIWDTIHTFIRPPAAGLIAVGALWAAPVHTRIAGALFAFLVALAAHGAKAGFRLALNTGTERRNHTWLSIGEDLAAVAFTVAALQLPGTALVAGAAVLGLMAIFGPRLWRAFSLGIRCLAAWFRALFSRSRWREADELPRALKASLGDTPMGAAPPRGTRAGIDGVPGIGAYRNGWLVLTHDGPVFVYRTLLGGPRVAPLPPPARLDGEPGLWADLIRVTAAGEASYTVYLLKDGPAAEIAIGDIGHSAPLSGRSSP